MCQTFIHRREKQLSGPIGEYRIEKCAHRGESQHFRNDTLRNLFIFFNAFLFFALLTAKFQTLACSISAQILLLQFCYRIKDYMREAPPPFLPPSVKERP